MTRASLAEQSTLGVQQSSALTIAAKQTIAVIGNPNTGKSTLFNALTGLRQKVANFPGVTVEKHLGQVSLPDAEIDLIDLPGTYSLSAHSPDEMIVIDILSGRVEGVPTPDAILIVADASNLRRNLFLVSQVLEIGLPAVIALNMVDVAQSNGIGLDVAGLSKHLQVEVVPLNATKGVGVNQLRDALTNVLRKPRVSTLNIQPELKAAAQAMAAKLRHAGEAISDYEVERALIDAGGYAEQRLQKRLGKPISDSLHSIRKELAQNRPLAVIEAQNRYAWINDIADEVETPGSSPGIKWSDRIDRIVSHPAAGSFLFLLLMAIVFQSVFAWATPIMDAIDHGTASVRTTLAARLPEGALASLLVDGVIAGVGSVIVFLPQILILFTFIILLEDTGYMARAAFLMDRLMRWCGLSGQSFIPMLSSFACAVPGIMATRVIPNRRDRLATILAAPFMTCSARLPVYALLISAFVPRQHYLAGYVNLQGLVLLGLYLLGITGGVLTAFMIKRTALRGPTPTFLMELPPYRMPNPKSVFLRLWERGRLFLVRAGTIIFTVAVVVWALVYFPRPQSVQEEFAQARLQAEQPLSGEALQSRIDELNSMEAAAYLEQSYLGRIGKTIEPLFKPLGWDWKVSSAVLASFPAREVVIAVLGTIYAVGDEVDEESISLRDRITASTWPDGRPVYTLPMAAGLLVFYAFCLQCAATVAAIGRETNGWRWPAIAWVYMTGLGYSGAFLVFQLGSRL